ncbi:MAG: S-layer homology domain-containing protein [Candidatus Gastranaerophilales bacterium]|nr:S-layer homology domain-containing protein [Candidatus Gastranaerophilales bacterium]
MKRLLAAFLAVSLLSFNITPVLAMDGAHPGIKDVAPGYWADRAIDYVITDDVMRVDENGKFNPEQAMTRAEFVTALLKVLSNDNLAICTPNRYSDITISDAYYNDIMRSDQLGLVYGYPDGTFKPNQAMLRSECTAVISHITKDNYADSSVLNVFEDKDDIPLWSRSEYAKTITYGIYINYPNPNRLEPNRILTRAEAAVILAQLKAKLTCVKPQYVGEVETVLGTEHLSVCQKAPCNIVKITNLRKVITKGNVIVVTFDDKFMSKCHKAGDVVNFVLPEALYTDEGTMLLPQGTKIVAEITRIQPPRKFNKNARVHLVYKAIVLPDGKCFNMCGKPFTKDCTLKEGPWMTFWKLFMSTVGLGIVGAGAGTGFAFIPNPAKLGVGFAIGIPVGCSVGLITGLCTPGLNYKAKKGEQVMVILLDDASINNK